MVAPIRRSVLPSESFGETPPACKFSGQCGRFCGSIFPWREAAIKTPTRWPPLLQLAGFLAFGGTKVNVSCKPKKFRQRLSSAGNRKSRAPALAFRVLRTFDYRIARD